MKEKVQHFMITVLPNLIKKFGELPIWIKVIIIIVVGLLVITIIAKLLSKSGGKNISIKGCVSSEDKRYELSLSEKRMLEKLESNRSGIQQAMKISKGRIHARWLSSHNEIIKVSSNLEANIRAYEGKRLDSRKFPYYCGLHFRTMMAADYSYKEYKQIGMTFNEINETLMLIGKGELRVSKDEKKALYGLKDEMKDIKNFWKNRVDNLNQETGQWRKKIGSECGERGRKWERARLNHN